MISIKKGLHEIDEVPIMIQVGGVGHTVTEQEVDEPNKTFEDAEDYYLWAADNVDGWGDPTYLTNNLTHESRK